MWLPSVTADRPLGNSPWASPPPHHRNFSASSPMRCAFPRTNESRIAQGSRRRARGATLNGYVHYPHVRSRKRTAVWDNTTSSGSLHMRRRKLVVSSIFRPCGPSRAPSSRHRAGRGDWKSSARAPRISSHATPEHRFQTHMPPYSPQIG